MKLDIRRGDLHTADHIPLNSGVLHQHVSLLVHFLICFVALNIFFLSISLLYTATTTIMF